MTDLIETIVNLTEKTLQAGALVGVVDNKWATGAYGAQKLIKDLREYKEGKLDKAVVAGEAANALTDYEVTAYLENRGWSPYIAKTVGLVMSWLADKMVEGIAHHFFKASTPTNEAVEKVTQAEDAKNKGGWFLGNAVHGLGGIGDKGANTIDVVPLAGLAAAPVELLSTGTKVAGDLLNLHGGDMVHDGLRGVGKTVGFLVEDVIPGSRYANAGVGVVSGTTVTTRIGKGLDKFVTGNSKN